MSFATGAPFEGEITATMTRGTPETMLFVIKGSKIRFNLPDRDGSDYAIFDNATKRLTTVAESRKTAIVLDLSALEPSAPETRIERTGRTDVIAGCACEIVNATIEDRGHATFCLARGIAFPQLPNAPFAWAAMGREEGFPLRAEISDRFDAPKARMTVTKIARKPIDDARLSAPVGYVLR